MKNSILTGLKCASLLLCLVVGAMTANADVKIKAKSTSGGTATETATYIKGRRQRMENNPMTVTITQCDLQRSVELNSATKTYLITPFEQKTTSTKPERSAERTAGAAPAQRGGIVTTTITATDTGERKQMFGYTARHIKTEMVTESSPEACSQTKTRMETDGWYIDFNLEFDCGNQNGGGYAPMAKSGGCRDEYRTKQVGTARTGYPVMVTTTIFDENGKQSFTWTQEVVEISNTTLDASLFEIPAGYTEVKDRQQLYSPAAMMSAARRSERQPAESAGGPDQIAATTGTPKKTGVLRIGVALPKVTSAGEGINSAALAEFARKTMMGGLRGPALEAVTLDAQQPQELEVEAKAKECDYILMADLAHKTGGGRGFGGLLKKAAPIAGVIATGGVGVGGGNSAEASPVQAIKAKDELSLNYQLRSVGGAVVLTNSQKAKAKADGEDLITSVVTPATSAVMTAVKK